MKKWILTDDATKRRAYSQIAESTGLSNFAAEKDWWMVQVLTTVFETGLAGHMVFKGGTSLSKAWQIISRFSEDIDLAIDRSFFGFTGEMGNNQRNKLRKTAGAYVDNVFFPEFKTAFEAKSFSDVKLVLEEGRESDRDRKINVYYPNVIPSPGYLMPRIQLEIGCRSLREPFSNKRICSLLDESFPNQYFTQSGVLIPTVNPERTFLEKIFLLHEQFQRPVIFRRADRLSRHMYDVVKLSDTVFADYALGDPILYETIVRHRYQFTRVGGVDYNLHQPQTINPVPEGELENLLRADYKTMAEQMIFESEAPSFDQIKSALIVLKEKMNRVLWRLKTKFPVSPK